MHFFYCIIRVKAIVIPIGVNTILIPSGSKICPNQPELEYKVVSAIPETAVGRAKGKSTIASKTLFPKNVYRTKHQATITPKIVLIRAAISEVTKVSL